MATQTTNRISVTVEEKAVEQAKQHLLALNELFPYLLGLTPNERQTLPKMDVSNKVFVEDALNAAKANSQVLPAYLNLKELELDKQGFERLEEIVVLTAQLAQKLRDTQMLMGSEAYVTALTVYRLFESASRDGVPGAKAAYEQLAKRFKGQGKSATKEEPAADTEQ